MPVAARVEFLLEDYVHFLGNPEAFCGRLDVLRPVQGHEVINDWQERARAGRWAEVVEELLTRHYDPVYDRSTARNYQQFGQTGPLLLPDGQAATLAAAARRLIITQPAVPAPAHA